MTRTEDRLADALSAVAKTVHEETLHPLIAPAARRRLAWIPPAAAAASVTLLAAGTVVVAGLDHHPARPSVPAAALAAVPRFYVEADLLSEKVTVRSTATGKVTATLPVRGPLPIGLAAVASAGNGTFFVAGNPPHSGRVQLYRFRVTGAGTVTGFTPLPGGLLPAGQVPDALAASPGGAQLAIGISFVKHGSVVRSDQLAVISTATGARKSWRGGTRGKATTFGVASLSWTGGGRRLVVLGQWCPPARGSTGALDDEVCDDGQASRVAEVWSVSPASGGGQLTSGQLLLRQSRHYPYIAQAMISPDGSTITAMVLAGPPAGQKGAGQGLVPDNMSIRQISVPSGRQLNVLYRRHLKSTFEFSPAPDFLSLTGDMARQHWIVIAGDYRPFNGWIYRGRLVPLIRVYVDGDPGSEAW